MTHFKFMKYTASSEDEEHSSLWKKLSNNKFYRILFGAAIGAVLGLLYWNFIDCSGGNCSLTSDPYKTVIMFSILGGLFAKNKKGERGCC